ncbi:DUF4442 domain-containing protein [Reichenbachiella agarivorans]|uniref:DUF4442 domain-containing protein n=1 Tax=Reichenbachiella agarivorans TaxID=2979464 RepID=A0ABY6CN83_9BACT|nr:DUF4442 domain-containing protein [Reichenbachiella agarivorans]UXP30808.1 DUF4442 domain-containing protein [Reichenbachiella agarivorans]
MNNTTQHFGFNAAQTKFTRQFLSPWKLRLFLLTKLPMGWLSGMKVTEINEQKAVTTVNHRWLNQNPFGSMYFAVQAMAAELSTGVLALTAVQGEKKKILAIIVENRAEFVKQAKERIYFSCTEGQKVLAAVDQAKRSKEPITVSLHVEGKTKNGTLVSVFHFSWNFKVLN